MNFFKLPTPSKTCADCKRSFDKEMGVYSSLMELKELTRKDFCYECFTKSEKPSIWWESPKVIKEAKPILLTTYEKQLYEMLISAIAEQNKSPEWVYFLASYFKRRKVFSSEGERSQDGTIYEVFVSKETQDVFILPKTYPKKNALQSIVEELKNVTGS